MHSSRTIARLVQNFICFRNERWSDFLGHSRINGVAVLGKKRNDSPEFKLNVIQAVKNGQFSAETAYLYFGIANSSVINRWLRVFEKQGINGLMPKPKGRP